MMLRRLNLECQGLISEEGRFDVSDESYDV